MPEDENVLHSQKQDSSVTGAVLPARYETKRVLGQGGMGTVYLAYDKQLGRDVAIKMVDSSNMPNAHERFVREAKMLAALDHPNIVKLLSWGHNDEGQSFLVMEYLLGTVLADEIGEGKRLSSSRFQSIFFPILSALSFAHSKGIRHRDIKPSNIFLCNRQSFCPMLIDFGIARQEDAESAQSAELTKTGQLLGSPTYMSPEQCKGQKADYSSDIFSLACVMYESLIGYPPQQGDTALDIMYKQSSVEHKHLEEIADSAASKRLGKLIDNCLSKDPEQRPQSAAELLAQLKDIFRQPIDTDKLFVQNKIEAKAKLGLAKLATTSAIAIMALAALAYGMQCNKSKLKSDELIAAESKTHYLQMSKELETQTEDFERKRSTEGSAKRAHRLKDKYITFSELQRKLGLLKESLTSLEKAQALTPEIDLEQGWKELVSSDLNQRKAEIYMDSGNLDLAQQFLAEASKLQTRPSKFQANLCLTRARYCILKHDFKSAQDEFQKFTGILQAVEIDQGEMAPLSKLKSSISGGLSQSYTAEKIAAFWKLIMNRPLQSGRNEIELVALMLDVCEAMLDQVPLNCAEMLKTINETLSHVPPQTPGLAEQSKRASKLEEAYHKAIAKN
ncbi:MAG: serine/threonine protein kinase [Candidatus Obscuribacterales bacterium]|nr:serine/threonine protein kinase [Candidatus Obscuribacterales bacterium]